MTHRLHVLLPAILLLVLAGAGCMGESDPATRLDELLDTDRDFAAMSRDQGPGAAFAVYLADDALQLPAGGEPVRGCLNIAAGFADAPGLGLEWTPLEGGVSSDGDLGWTWGHFTASMPGEDGEVVSSGGKYLNVWERDARGRWRVLVDMGNGDPDEE